MKMLYELDCAGKRFRVYEDCISFSPKGLTGFLTKGISGERKIYYKDISSIQFKESSKLLSGFIEFYIVGQNTKQGGGLFSGTDNENRFTFYNKQLPTMLEIKEFIENKLNGDNSKSSNDLDDLIKLKELLDKGIITQEEFNQKKKQLLGI